MALDQPTPAGPPAAYFPNVGDAIVVGIVDVGEFHQKDYDSGQLKYWDDAKKQPVIGKIVTGLVVSAEGSTAAGTERDHRPIEIGETVTFWCEGGKYFTYRDALNEAGMVDIGYVMKWWREDDTPPKSAKHYPGKVYKAKIRKPKPEDGDLAARCQARHDELKRGSALDSAPDEREPAAASVAEEF